MNITRPAINEQEYQGMELRTDLPQVVTYGIVRWHFSDYTERPIDPATIPLTDENPPRNLSTKGTPIPILKWLDYVYKIQAKNCANWVITPRNAWINEAPNACETVTFSGNFHEIIGDGVTHWRLNSQRNDTITSLLNPTINNWYNEPARYMKLTARDMEGHVFNVGAGLDCQAPLIHSGRQPYTWIRKEDIELFPKLPEGMLSYKLVGASVYGFTGSEYIPLRLARKPGELIHPYPGWKLETLGVVPAAVI